MDAHGASPWPFSQAQFSDPVSSPTGGHGPWQAVPPRHSMTSPLQSQSHAGANMDEDGYGQSSVLLSPSAGRRRPGQGQGQAAYSHHTLQPGPGLGPSRGARPTHSHSRATFKQPPSGVQSSNEDLASRLYRQRFRERCQAVMARDKGRQRALARARGRDVLLSGGGGGEKGDGRALGDSDEEEAEGAAGDGATMPWQKEDEEMVRRAMLAEYRRLVTAQESSGQRELGWLDPDEVAWLEEEIKKDDSHVGGGGGSGEGGGGMEVEPPADFLDEEMGLYEQYQHAMQPAPAPMQMQRDDFDMDDDIFTDEALSQIEGLAPAGTQGEMDLS